MTNLCAARMATHTCVTWGAAEASCSRGRHAAGVSRQRPVAQRPRCALPPCDFAALPRARARRLHRHCLDGLYTPWLAWPRASPAVLHSSHVPLPAAALRAHRNPVACCSLSVETQMHSAGPGLAADGCSFSEVSARGLDACRPSIPVVPTTRPHTALTPFLPPRTRSGLCGPLL